MLASKIHIYFGRSDVHCIPLFLFMRIGFDAKRAFHNVTGLGNYSRTLINSLIQFYPNENYILFNPKHSAFYNPSSNNCKEIRPTTWFSKLFPSLWRSRLMLNEINREVDLFHGLSNELPFGIHTSTIKKVVTIHDLIFEYYPEQYKKNDVLIYRKKFKYACQSADKIIAISESTKKDLIELYQIDENKITVCFQSCDERFYTCATEKHKRMISEKYGLQSPYILSVGSIIERKNLLNVCKAFNEIQKELDLQLVIIGKGSGAYKELVMNYLNQNNLNHKVKFLEDKYPSQDIYKDLPTIYQNAKAFVYPSIKEGFGIPILEAMASGTPVVTSNISSLIEAGGDAAITINPNNESEIKDALSILCTNEMVREEYISKGFERAKLFNNENTCKRVMNVYKELIQAK